MSQPSVVGSQGQIWLCCLGKRDSVSLSLSPVNHRDSSQWWIALSSKCTESITLPCDAVVYSLNTFLSSKGFEFFETSAKDNINVKQTFECLVDVICEKMADSIENNPAETTGTPTTKLNDNAVPPQQSECSC